MIDDLLELARFVELEKRGHLVALTEQVIAFFAELVEGVPNLGEFSFERLDPPLCCIELSVLLRQ